MIYTSKRYKWRIVELKYETTIIPDSKPIKYLVIQRKNKNVDSDDAFYDVKWFNILKLEDAKSELEDRVERDNMDSNVYTYYPLLKTLIEL